MAASLHKAVAWLTLVQVMLVGAGGMGLHGLLGCAHGPLGCSQAICNAASCDATVCRPAANRAAAKCHNCAFCRKRAASSEATTCKVSGAVVAASASADCCDACALCDLLMQYHSATPVALNALAYELASSELPVRLENGVVSATTRLALSRGPPTA